MACLKKSAALVVVLLTGCTATPERLKRVPDLPGQSALSVESTDNSKAQVVASAAIGVPQVYVDQEFGKSVELVVQSEYFSANGRICRRYTEFNVGQSISGVSCKDDVSGWVDIPLSSFIR